MASARAALTLWVLPRLSSRRSTNWGQSWGLQYFRHASCSIFSTRSGLQLARRATPPCRHNRSYLSPTDRDVVPFCSLVVGARYN